MGKGSNGNLISAVEKFRLQTPSDSAMKNLITWEEVAKHNTKNDCWIVVNNIVYNVSNFRKKHPGGSKILEFYAGQDATVKHIFFFSILFFNNFRNKKLKFNFRKFSTRFTRTLTEWPSTPGHIKLV